VFDDICTFIYMKCYYSAWGRRRTLNERNAGTSDIGQILDLQSSCCYYYYLVDYYFLNNIGIARESFAKGPERVITKPTTPTPPQATTCANNNNNNSIDERCNSAPTNETETDETRLSMAVDDVAQLVDAFVAEQRALAVKYVFAANVCSFAMFTFVVVDRRKTAASKKKTRSRVQGGWASNAKRK
jgi:hypothetical protein